MYFQTTYYRHVAGAFRGSFPVFFWEKTGQARHAGRRRGPRAPHPPPCVLRLPGLTHIPLKMIPKPPPFPVTFISNPQGPPKAIMKIILTFFNICSSSLFSDIHSSSSFPDIYSSPLFSRCIRAGDMIFSFSSVRTFLPQLEK